MQDQLKESKNEVQAIGSQLQELSAKQENNQQNLDKKEAEIASFKLQLKDVEATLQQSEVRHADGLKEINNEANHLSSR